MSKPSPRLATFRFPILRGLYNFGRHSTGSRYGLVVIHVPKKLDSRKRGLMNTLGFLTWSALLRPTSDRMGQQRQILPSQARQSQIPRAFWMQNENLRRLGLSWHNKQLRGTSLLKHAIANFKYPNKSPFLPGATVHFSGPLEQKLGERPDKSILPLLQQERGREKRNRFLYCFRPPFLFSFFWRRIMRDHSSQRRS